MASGVKVDDDVKNKYQGCCLTTSKTTKLLYAIFKFSDDFKKIIVEKYATAAEANCDYDTFVSGLPPDDCRFAVYDFPYITKEGNPKSDILFIVWCPDSCPIRKKMICASSVGAVKAALSISKNILEGDGYSEISSKAALEKVGGRSLV